MTYDVEGIVPAPYFFAVGKTSGRVTVKSSLRNDREFEYVVSSAVYFWYPYVSGQGILFKLYLKCHLSSYWLRENKCNVGLYRMLDCPQTYGVSSGCYHFR